MIVLQLTILIFVVLAGAAVVLTRNPEAQVVGISFFGLILSIMFMVFQARRASRRS